jgi:nucleoside-diphosphate-sugar epimerase
MEGTSSRRDDTFIDDIVGRLSPASNRGTGRSISLLELLVPLKEVAGCRAMVEQSPDQPADPVATCADISAATEHLGYIPRTNLPQGLAKTVAWLAVDTPLTA